jgi:hypothetical protein
MNTDAIFDALNKLAITPIEGRLPKAFALLDLLDQLSFKSESSSVDKAYDFRHDLRSAKISFGILEGYLPADAQEVDEGGEYGDQPDGQAELESRSGDEGDLEDDPAVEEPAPPIDESELLLETLQRLRDIAEP